MRDFRAELAAFEEHAEGDMRPVSESTFARNALPDRLNP